MGKCKSLTWTNIVQLPGGQLPLRLLALFLDNGVQAADTDKTRGLLVPENLLVNPECWVLSKSHLPSYRRCWFLSVLYSYRN